MKPTRDEIERHLENYETYLVIGMYNTGGIEVLSFGEEGKTTFGENSAYAWLDLQKEKNKQHAPTLKKLGRPYFVGFAVMKAESRGLYVERGLV